MRRPFFVAVSYDGLARRGVSLHKIVGADVVGDKVVDAILRITRGARPESATSDVIRNQVAWGPGPRASQALMLASLDNGIR